MSDLSILIPARNEMFLARTIEDILSNIEADTEIIAVLDGAWADPPIPQNDRVNVIYLPQSIGQRAATNLACKLSKSKYVMKCDAHCAFDKGFDRKMIEAFEAEGDNVTIAPIMRNLWAFDWKCFNCGWKKYQGPTPKKCEQCGQSDKLKRKMIWVGKNNPQSTSFCFDSTPHFQYFEDWKHRPQYEKDKAEKRLTETMSLQGSCWMLTREKYWQLNICDENFGSWGSQGIEVAVKTWLSGGTVLVNHNTWYAHMFRTQGGDFGFPYPISVKDQKKAKDFARDLFFNNKWDQQIHPLSWLVEKFWPVKGWSDEDLENLQKNKFEFKTSSTSSVNTAEIEPAAEASVTDAALEQAASMAIEELQPEIESIADSEFKILTQSDTAPIELTVSEDTQLEEELDSIQTIEDLSTIEPEMIPDSAYSAVQADTDLTENQTTQLPELIENPKTVTIIGHGWVGKSVQTLFPQAYIYNPPKSTSKRKANKSDVAFICVPTPAIGEGKLDISIVEQCVAWSQSPLIVIRSTVNPGTADYLAKKYNKRIVIQPEYLGETVQHPLLDEKNTRFIIIGGNPEDRRALINLYTRVYNANVNIRQVTTYEAEVIKLSENRAIAFKVGQCQELYDVCEKAGIDYYTIRDAVYGDDPRFNLWFTFVKPYDRGFNSKCIPKDVFAWCAWAESLEYNPEITRFLLAANKKWLSPQSKA